MNEIQFSELKRFYYSFLAYLLIEKKCNSEFDFRCDIMKWLANVENNRIFSDSLSMDIKWLRDSSIDAYFPDYVNMLRDVYDKCVSLENEIHSRIKAEYFS